MTSLRVVTDNNVWNLVPNKYRREGESSGWMRSGQVTYPCNAYFISRFVVNIRAPLILQFDTKIITRFVFVCILNNFLDAVIVPKLHFVLCEKQQTWRSLSLWNLIVFVYQSSSAISFHCMIKVMGHLLRVSEKCVPKLLIV